MGNTQGGAGLDVEATVATAQESDVALQQTHVYNNHIHDEESDAALQQTHVYKNRIHLCWTKCEAEGCERSCFNFRNCDDCQFGYSSSTPGGLCSVHVLAKRTAVSAKESLATQVQPGGHPQQSWSCQHAWSCPACAFLNSDMALQCCSACNSPRFPIERDSALPARPLKMRRTELMYSETPLPLYDFYFSPDWQLSIDENALHPADESTEDETCAAPLPELNSFPIECEENADQLLQRIEQHDPNFTKLEILESSRCWSMRVILGEYGCAALARVLPLNMSITSLSFENSELGPAGARLLFPALTHLTALTYLNLCCTDLQSAGISHLCSALGHLTAITELNLSQNKLTEDDGARICSAAAAAGLRRLRTLSLNDNHLSSASDVVGCGEWRRLNLPQPPNDFVVSADFSILVQYLMSNDKAAFAETHHPDLPMELLERIETSDPALTKLEIFYKSKFNEVGCKILARSLVLNTRITSLDIEYTSVGPAGARLLFPALTHLTALTYLKFYDTDLQSAGISHLCSALGHLTAITELNLSQNKLTEDDGARICSAAAAAGLRRLQCLYFGYESTNKFNSESVVESKLWGLLKLPKPSHEIVQKCKDANSFSNCVPLVKHILLHFERCCIHAHSFEVQKQFDLALPLHEEVLHVQSNVFGRGHPISKHFKYKRDMCVFSAFGYSLGIMSALSACDFVEAELKQLRSIGFIAPVSGYWRLQDAIMPHEERLRTKCGGAVGLLVKRITWDASTPSKSQTDLFINRNTIAINVQSILCRVIAGNAAARRAFCQRLK